MFPKNTRTRLKTLKPLFLEALERDNYTCIVCGCHLELITDPPHHILYGSKKEDVLENLASLCGDLNPKNYRNSTRGCHSKVHAHLLAIEPYLSESQIAYMADKNKLNHVREVAL